MKRALFAVALVALVALPASAQVDLTRYCALGDSLTAGFVSGGLMQYYQERSYPAMLANQVGAGFEMPLVSEPGLPVLYELISLQGPTIGPPAVAPGQPINATYPGIYNNLGVPGADLYDLMFTTGDIYNLLGGNTDNVMHDLILRDGQHTALEQCIGSQPTFVTMFIGNNDILGAALVATPIEGVTMTPVATFAQLYPQALGALATNTGADLVVMTLPYPTAIPFITTVSPFLTIPGVGQIPIMGSNGPLTADDYVTLQGAAMLRQGYGVPGGPPLPEDLNFTTGAPGFVLRAEEAATINGRIDEYNAIIRDAAHTYGAHVLDVNAMFNEILAGDAYTFGGWSPSADFLVGGIFSYDGVHPQNIGYALVTYELINLLNEDMGAAIPQLNFDQILCGNGGCGGYSPEDVDAKNATLSDEAFQRLLDLFLPNLGNRVALDHQQQLVD